MTKSAIRGTATSDSSSAVRCTSSVVPIRTPASYRKDSRPRATSAWPDSACSSVVSRKVATSP